MKKNPVKPAVVVPPGSIFTGIDGALQVALGNLGRPARFGHVKGNDSSIWFGQDQQIALREFPEGLGAVLDGRGMLGGHQRLHGGEIGEHRSHTRQLQFSLPLDTFEGLDRLLGAVLYLLLNLGVHGVPDKEEQGACESKNDQQGGDEELGS